MMDPLSILGIFALSACIAAALSLPRIGVGLDMADEGYLWHGVREVIKGGVPIRDFRAYDPGRYYWYALWMRLLGTDIGALRWSSFITQIIALAAGVSALHKVLGEWPLTVAAALVLAASFPRHHTKQFDALVCMTAVLVAVSLVVDPHQTTGFRAGVFVGLSVFAGINHVLYASGGLLVVGGILLLHGDPSAAIDLGVSGLEGVALGVLPVVLMTLFVPGYGSAYIERKIVPIFRRKTTNLGLAVPWIWASTPMHLRHKRRVHVMLTKTMFTFMPCFYGIVVFAAIAFGPGTPVEWAVFAASAIGLFYMHHALSRADSIHLALASGPFAIALCLALSGFAWTRVLLYLIATPIAVYVLLALAGRVSKRARRGNHVRCRTNGVPLWVPDWQASFLDHACALVEQYSDSSDRALFLPTLATLYPLTGRRSAVYDIFCVYPATADAEEAMIGEIRRANTKLALINNQPLDGREELRFSETHPRVWQFLLEQFTSVSAGESMPADHHLFVSRASGENAVHRH